MKKKHLLFSLLGAFLFVACEQTSEVLEPEPVVENPVISKSVFSGYAQKGPFINGSSITISELDANLDQTGRVYLTSIADNSGSFEKKNIELVSNYVALKADGYYFNEISGKTSGGQITLYALVDVEDVNSANVNVLTHLEKPRVEYLVTQEGMSFAAAKQQAQREVLAIFGFESLESSSEALDLTDNAALLAISCILQGYLSTGDMMELMANISTDIKTDGKLDDTALGSKLMNNAYAISLSIANVRNNLTAKYTELGIDVTIPDFESYVQSFLDSNLYPQTLFITYPATGMYGGNILSDAVTSVKQYLYDDVPDSWYSMKADVPEGQSLKIVLKDGIWSNLVAPVPLNWNVGQRDYTNQRQEYTVTESGKPNDMKMLIVEGSLKENGKSYITIEYYENGSTTPTKVKKLYIE